MGLVLLCSCGTVGIKEENFYTDEGINGAVETHFYSTDISSIAKPAWDSMREGMTCMTSQSFGDIKSEIEKLCTVVKCTEVNPSYSETSINMQTVKKEVRTFKQYYEAFYMRLQNASR